MTVTTRDGVALEADYRRAAAPGRPAVLLLHMIPPSNDRTNWPTTFVDQLAAHDWSVVVLDRRGAGGSGGVAQDAYEGEAGKYDVEAAIDLLSADGAGAVAIIGASNGTTSMIDYAVWAGGEGLPVPVGLGFMTGGTYTETQTDMAEVAAMGLPAVFTYSTAERAWSVDQEPLEPGPWQFLEYDPGDHGTRMFGVAPEVSDHLDDWLVGVLEG